MALPVTENFTGTAGALSDPPWYHIINSISRDGSGRGKGTTDGADNASVNDSETFAPDQYAKMVSVTKAGASKDYGMVLRGANSGISFLYMMYQDTAVGCYSVTTGPTWTLVGTTTNYTHNTGDTLRAFARDGNAAGTPHLQIQTQSAFRWGISTSSGLMTGGYVGIGAYDPDTGLFDDFEAGNLPVDCLATGSQSNSGTTSHALIVDTTVAVGDLICVAVAKRGPYDDPYVVGDISKSGGTCTVGSWTLDKEQRYADSGTTVLCAIYSCVVTGAGTLTQVNVTALASNGPVIGGMRVYHPDTGSFGANRLDTSNSSEGSSSTMATGSVTPAGEGVVFGVMASDCTTFYSITLNTQFAQIAENEDGGGGGCHGVVFDNISLEATAQSPTAPISGTYGWVGLVVVYKKESATPTIEQEGSRFRNNDGHENDGTVTVVNHNRFNVTDASNQQTITITSTTAGNYLLLYAWGGYVVTSATAGGTSMTQKVTGQGYGTWWGALYELKNIPAGITSVVFNYTGYTQFRGCVLEISGAGIDPYDTSSFYGGTYDNNDIQLTQITTGSVPGLVYVYIDEMYSLATGCSAGTGWTGGSFSNYSFNMWRNSAASTNYGGSTGQATGVGTNCGWNAMTVAIKKAVAATWDGSQDADKTGVAGTERVRFILNNTLDPAAITPQYEYRRKPSGGSFGDWKKIGLT